MGVTSARTYSGHHQAVNVVGRDLVVVGSAADGIIAALELPGHPWLVAVQWHPEMSAATEPSQVRLFDSLVAAARR